MKSITLKHNGKEYELGFTRASIILCERKLDLSELIGKGSDIVKAFDLFYASFFMKYPNMKEELVVDIFAETKNKGKLIELLSNMYAETMKSLFLDEENESEKSEEGNTNWEAN